MSATPTLVASGSWTDFSVKTLQPMGVLSQGIPVGDRVFLVIASTVAAGVGVAPGAAGWGGIDFLWDTAGNVFTRDTPTAGIDTTGQGTAEIWSAYVKYPIPVNGYGLVVTPDSRGLSTYWKLIGVNGLAEAVDGSTSPLDKVQQAIDNNTTTFSTGATAALSTTNTWVLAAHLTGSQPAAPWFTDTSGFTKIGADQSGNAPGSSRALSVLHKSVSATTGVSSDGTVTAPISGASVIAAYKVAASPVSPDTTGAQLVQSVSAQTAAGTSQGVTMPSNTQVGNALIACATAWKTGGGDPGVTIADNKGNVWTPVPAAAAPSTSGGARAYMWICKQLTSAGASHTITATANASAEISLVVAEYSGIDTSATVPDQRAQATGNSTAPAPGSVTTPSYSIYMCVMTEDSGVTFMNSSGWSKLADISTGQDLHVQWQKAAAQTINPTMGVAAATTWAALQGTFKATAPSGGGGGGGGGGQASNALKRRRRYLRLLGR